MITRTGPRTRRETPWCIGVAALSVAGAAALAFAPAGVARAYPLTALGLLLSFALGAVVADAVWNGRSWRDGAAVVSLLAIGLLTMANVVERIVVGGDHGWILAAPRAIRVLMLGCLMVLVERPVRSARGIERPRPTPLR